MTLWHIPMGCMNKQPHFLPSGFPYGKKQSPVGMKRSVKTKTTNQQYPVGMKRPVKHKQQTTRIP